jgi:hypothetical protein
MFFKRVPRVVLMAPLAVMLAACSESITDPVVSGPSGGFQLRSVFLPNPEVAICKRGGELEKQYPFTLQATGGTGYTLPLGTAFHAPSTADNCFVMFFPGQGTTTLTLSEVEGYMPSMIVLERVGLINSVDTVRGVSSVTFDASAEQVVYVFVHNDAVPPPPPPPPTGTQGCTPGYWKQSQHFGSWKSPYSPSSSRFNTVFGVSLFSGSTTMLQALGTGGGGRYRLGRHATAALLNAANNSVNYGMTTAQVIAAVRAAAQTGNYDSAADAFEARNEKGCPLGRADLPKDKDKDKGRDKDKPRGHDKWDRDNDSRWHRDHDGKWDDHDEVDWDNDSDFRWHRDLGDRWDDNHGKWNDRDDDRKSGGRGNDGKPNGKDRDDGRKGGWD